MKKPFSIFFLFYTGSVFSQFAPPVGSPGTTALYKDSSAFVNWANACTITRGYQDISDTSYGYATVGDSSMALGPAASNGVVSLGDGGIAILQFPFPITDGPGYDFAVFENAFSNDYLEFAFVEVSSDGINFSRFNAISNIQDTIQTGPFGLSDASKINNLAGKYRMNYGTPFDLNELSGISGLDLSNITHVKIIDAVGAVNDSFATYDGNFNRINDPWPTAFPSSGFDLDAVGVIHENNQVGISGNNFIENFTAFTDAYGNIHCSFKAGFTGNFSCMLSDLGGKKINLDEKEKENYCNAGKFYNFSYRLPEIENGLYILQLFSDNGKKITKKIFIP